MTVDEAAVTSFAVAVALHLAPYFAVSSSADSVASLGLDSSSHLASACNQFVDHIQDLE